MFRFTSFRYFSKGVRLSSGQLNEWGSTSCIQSEKNVNEDGVNDTTNETTDTPHLRGYVSDGDDKESTPASQKTSKNTTKKGKGRP